MTRWHEQTCSRCRVTLTEGQATHELCAARYAPMETGPDWIAVGDWQEPATLGPVLCADCLDAVRYYAMGTEGVYARNKAREAEIKADEDDQRQVLPAEYT